MGSVGSGRKCVGIEGEWGSSEWMECREVEGSLWKV